MKRLNYGLACAFLILPAAALAGCDGDEASASGDAGGSTGSNDDGNSSAPTASAGDDGMMTAGSGGGGSGDDGANFITPPDGGVAGQCDPGLQDCPNEDEKCTSFVSTPGGDTVDATHCVPVMGMGQFGESCVRGTDNDDCDKGFFCMTQRSGFTGDGFCLEFCTPMGAPCEFGGNCFAFNDGALPICQSLCNPLLQDCPAGQGCYRAFEQFVCAIPGPDVGLGADNDPCNTIQSCNPGLACAGGTEGCAAEAACCTPFCDMSGANPCGGTEECVAVSEAPTPGLENVGLCAIPA